MPIYNSWVLVLLRPIMELVTWFVLLYINKNKKKRSLNLPDIENPTKPSPELSDQLDIAQIIGQYVGERLKEIFECRLKIVESNQSKSNIVET